MTSPIPVEYTIKLRKTGLTLGHIVSADEKSAVEAWRRTPAALHLAHLTAAQLTATPRQTTR